VATLVDQTLDLPRINYGRHNGRPYRYAYGCGADQTTSNFFDRLVKLDVADRTVTVWREDGCFPSEPVFVAAPGSSAEDEGVVLSVVLDAAAGRSALLVLDARRSQRHNDRTRPGSCRGGQFVLDPDSPPAAAHPVLPRSDRYAS
jgi:carotenoid cleavage dioxygenase-like enzyme